MSRNDENASSSSRAAARQFNSTPMALQAVARPKTRARLPNCQWRVLEERESGLAKRQNAWSPTYVDELIERDRDSNGKVTTDFGSAVDAASAVRSGLQDRVCRVHRAWPSDNFPTTISSGAAWKHPPP